MSRRTGRSYLRYIVAGSLTKLARELCQTRRNLILPGVLAAVIAIQWTTSAVQSQAPSVRASEFILEGADGEIVGGMATDEDGRPFMFLSMETGTRIAMAADPTGAIVTIQHSAGPSVTLGVAESTALVEVAAYGDEITTFSTGNDGTFIRAEIEEDFYFWPSDPFGDPDDVSTSQKPLSWGEVKSQIDDKIEQFR